MPFAHKGLSGLQGWVQVLRSVGLWQGDMSSPVTPSIPEGGGQKASLLYSSANCLSPSGADALQAGTSDPLGSAVSSVTEGTASSHKVRRDPRGTPGWIT